MDWLGLIFGLTGTYMLTRDHKGRLIGWLLLIVASIAFGIFAYHKDSIAMLITQAMYLILEVYAFNKELDKSDD